MTNSRLLAAVLATEGGAGIDAAVLPALAAAVDLVDRVLAAGRDDQLATMGPTNYHRNRLDAAWGRLGAAVTALRDMKPAAG